MAHASIVGLSLGGAVAVDFAVTYPEATDALLPVDAALIGGYTWAVDAHWERLFVLAKASEAGLQAAKIFWLQHPFFTPADVNGRKWLVTAAGKRSLKGKVTTPSVAQRPLP